MVENFNRKVVYFVLFALIHCCKSEIRKVALFENHNLKNSNISFIFDSPVQEAYLFKDISIRMSRKFPKPNLRLETFMFIPSLTISSLVLNEYEQNINLNNVSSNQIFSYNIENGDYYLSIDTYRAKLRYIGPMEDYFFVANFGFEHPTGGDYDKFYETSRKTCESNEDYTINGKHTPKYIVCPKIIIKENQKVTIKLQVSEKKWNDFSTLLFKFIPGLIILGPINSYPEPYFQRKFSINIEYIDKQEFIVE